MAAAGTETRHGWLGPALRGRRDERPPDARPAVRAPRDGRDGPAGSSAATSGPERAEPREGVVDTVRQRSQQAAAPPDAFHDQWEAALSDLELEVAAAEDLLAHLHRDAEAPPAAPRRPWVPPTGLGPLPAPLADRARALAERQTRTAEALGRAIVLNRRQARAVDVLTDARAHQHGSAQALYLDVAL